MSRTLPLALLLALLVPSAATAAPKARGSVEQVYVTGAKPGAKLTLRGHGRSVTKRAGRLGGAVFRGVKPGRYRVAGRRVRVLPNRSAPPSTRIYRQKIPAKGYGYLTTRDGTQLAVNVSTPPGPGPFPTLVEYSGYAYADPDGAASSIGAVAPALGYAVVDVNMRGTGCSGGAFDFFEPLQNLDGYDVIETVARQPWVRGKVGMLGVSYGGISQLFVAQTRPPSLAAIAPLSVIDSTQTTLYPGGILNTGFALSWAKDRVHDAKPASATGGQPWALKRIRGGDRTCAANQALHAEAIDLLAKVRRNDHYRPKVADPISPVTFVHRINVPVYLGCQWTDEQTGGHCPTLPRRFTGTRRKWFTFTNGTHTDSVDPVTFNRFYDFLELYVAKRRPQLPQAIRDAAPLFYKSILGVDGVTLPDDPIQAQPSFAAAKAAFEALPPVRILFDNGAGGAPFVPSAGFERSFSRFPLPGTAARSWYLAADGTLADVAPGAGVDSFTWSRTARPATSFTGNTGSGTNGLWTATPSYRWSQNPPGSAASYVSAPLTADTAVVGAGSLVAWVRSQARDVDLQATVTEVRPDGQETYVQSGWLRASLRALGARGTLLEPQLTLRRRDASPMPKGRFAPLTIPLYYQGHVYRAGSRVRVTVSAPRGDQPVWAFAETHPRSGTTGVTIARGGARQSRLVLPVVPGIDTPTPLPACPALRGQPCRPFVR
jgi:uncharacterized protein